MASHPDGMTKEEARTLVACLLADERELIQEWAVMARVTGCPDGPEIPHTHVVYYPGKLESVLCLITEAARVVVKCREEDG